MKGEKILNPATGRMVLKTGAIGKKLVAEQAARVPSAPKPQSANNASSLLQDLASALKAKAPKEMIQKYKGKDVQYRIVLSLFGKKKDDKHISVQLNYDSSMTFLSANITHFMNGLKCTADGTVKQHVDKMIQYVISTTFFSVQVKYKVMKYFSMSDDFSTVTYYPIFKKNDVKKLNLDSLGIHIDFNNWVENYLE